MAPPPLNLLSIEEGDHSPNHEKENQNQERFIFWFRCFMCLVLGSLNRIVVWGVCCGFGLGRVMVMDCYWTHVYGVLETNNGNHNCSNGKSENCVLEEDKC